MCSIPLLCGMPDFVLRGSLTEPPEGGWRIRTVPPEAAHLQDAWAAAASPARGAKDAWWAMLSFLAANGVKSGAITKAVIKRGKDQWCSPNPERCRGLHTLPSTPDLPWAKDAWEDANRKLADGVTSPATVLHNIVRTLTTLINGPEGCPKCAAHWAKELSLHPVPENPTLEEARHWLVDRHNETREGKTPTPYAEVAAKFNWTTP